MEVTPEIHSSDLRDVATVGAVGVTTPTTFPPRNSVRGQLQRIFRVDSRSHAGNAAGTCDHPM